MPDEAVEPLFLRVPPDLKHRLRLAAAVRDCSMNEAAIELLASALDDEMQAPVESC